MNKTLLAALMLAGASLSGGVGTADAAETRLLFATASGPYVRFYDVANQAILAVKGECRALSGTAAPFSKIEKAVREGDNVTITVSMGCTF